jgi:DnaJ-class molecular chaperone
MLEAEEKALREKQEELGLNDYECFRVVKNLQEFFSFSEKQTQLSDYLLEFLEGRIGDNKKRKKCKKCKGTGKYLWTSENAENSGAVYEIVCDACDGKG